VIAGQDWVDGRQAARLLGLRTHHGKKQTKWERFLSEMDVVVPLQALIELIEPHYPKTSKKGGRSGRVPLRGVNLEARLP
jgi:hypothetical protein